MNKIPVSNEEQINTSISGCKGSGSKQEGNTEMLALTPGQESDSLKRLETNAPLSVKLEADSQIGGGDSDWEVLETRTIAVDCAFVNFQATKVRLSTRTTISNELADAIFENVVEEVAGHFSF